VQRSRLPIAVAAHQAVLQDVEHVIGEPRIVLDVVARLPDHRPEQLCEQQVRAGVAVHAREARDFRGLEQQAARVAEHLCVRHADARVVHGAHVVVHSDLIGLAGSDLPTKLEIAAHEELQRLARRLAAHGLRDHAFVLLDRFVEAGGGEVFLLAEVIHHRCRHEVELRGDVGERHPAHAFVIEHFDGGADDRVPPLVELVSDRSVGAWSHGLPYYGAIGPTIDYFCAGSIVEAPGSCSNSTRNFADFVSLALRETSCTSSGDS
jgi:hypothetical protein